VSQVLKQMKHSRSLSQYIYSKNVCGQTVCGLRTVGTIRVSNEHSYILFIARTILTCHLTARHHSTTLPSQSVRSHDLVFSQSLQRATVTWLSKQGTQWP